MTIALSRRIDASVARWYRCVLQCVRRPFLLGEGTRDGKGLLVSRLDELAQTFAIAVSGFSSMAHH